MQLLFFTFIPRLDSEAHLPLDSPSRPPCLNRVACSTRAAGMAWREKPG